MPSISSSGQRSTTSSGVRKPVWTPSACCTGTISRIACASSAVASTRYPLRTKPTSPPSSSSAFANFPAARTASLIATSFV